VQFPDHAVYFFRNLNMPAKLRKQQMAAGAALAAKRGERSRAALKGASRNMARSMSEEQLRISPKRSARNCPPKRVANIQSQIHAPARRFRSGERARLGRGFRRLAEMNSWEAGRNRVGLDWTGVHVPLPKGSHWSNCSRACRTDRSTSRWNKTQRAKGRGSVPKFKPQTSINKLYDLTNSPTHSPAILDILYRGVGRCSRFGVTHCGLTMCDGIQR
jgi:hypothetical protein